MHPAPSPSRDHLHAALLAFIEVYARRHQEMNAQLRARQITRQEMSTTSRMLTAIQAFIESQWLGTTIALPEEYHFEPRQLADLIEVEMAGYQRVTATTIEPMQGRERLVAALALIDMLLMADGDDEDDGVPGFV